MTKEKSLFLKRCVQSKEGLWNVLVALAEENREMELSILHTNAPESWREFKDS